MAAVARPRLCNVSRRDPTQGTTASRTNITILTCLHPLGVRGETEPFMHLLHQTDVEILSVVAAWPTPPTSLPADHGTVSARGPVLPIGPVGAVSVASPM